MQDRDLRLLADRTSHVIWQDDTSAHMWRRSEMSLFEETAPRGRRTGQIGADAITIDVHARHLAPWPTRKPDLLDLYVFDTLLPGKRRSHDTGSAHRRADADCAIPQSHSRPGGRSDAICILAPIRVAGGSPSHRRMMAVGRPT